jgi:periplasmic protein TonB
MQNKKNPKYNLDNYSKIFMQLGLVLALFVAYVIVEFETVNKQLKELSEVSFITIVENETIITKRPEPKIPKVKKSQPFISIDKKKDLEDLIETVIKPIDSEPKVSDFLDTFTEVKIDEEIVEDVPMDFVENAPIFPGCKGNNQELKDCFNKKIQQHFQKKFDSDLPNELGLSSGKKRVIMLFKIDELGNIIDIRTKAPHPKLDKEAQRIIKLLPKMKPGQQQGKAVRVKYTLPMRIDVE